MSEFNYKDFLKNSSFLNEVEEKEEEIELEDGVGIMAKPSKKPKTEEDEE